MDNARQNRGPSRPSGMAPKKAAGGTTVSVVIKVRPPLKEERHLEHCVTVDGEQVIVDATVPYDDWVHGEDGPVKRKSNQKSQMFECEFDQVLDITASQEQTWEALRVKAEAVLNGYNVTFLTYGMTGSGKTYTMMGPEMMAASWSCETGAPRQDSTSAKTLANCPDRGLIARAAQMIFQEAKGDVRVSMSYLQIYHEMIFDLLQPPQCCESLKLRDDPSRPGGVIVDGLTEAPCRSMGELFTMLLWGSQNRAFRSTMYNEQSSRSHVVLTLHIEQVTDAASGTVRRSKLHLVDLAGNEKWDIFGPKMTKEHTKELTSINKSLSALGNCVQALTQSATGKEKSHIPYRDSKLTHLLRDSLGGNGYTIMLCTICGCSHYQLQTISTLRFADRAKRVKMQAKVNETVDMSMLVKKYQREVSYLRGLVGQQGTEELQKQLDELEKQNQALQEQVGDLEQQNKHLQDHQEEWMASSKGMFGGRSDDRSSSGGNNSSLGRSFYGRSLRQAARIRRTCSEPDILFRLESSELVGDDTAVSSAMDASVGAAASRGRSLDVRYASERLSSAPAIQRSTMSSNPGLSEFERQQPRHQSKWGVCQEEEEETNADLPRLRAAPLQVVHHEIEADHGESSEFMSQDETLAKQLEEENRALRAQIQASTLAEKLEAQNQALRDRLDKLSAAQTVQSASQVQRRPSSATRGGGAAARGQGPVDAARRTTGVDGGGGNANARGHGSVDAMSSRGFRMGDESPRIYAQPSRIKQPQGGPRRRPNTKSPARRLASRNMSSQQQQAQIIDMSRQQKLLDYYNKVNGTPVMEHQSVLNARYAGSTNSSPLGPVQRCTSATADSAPASDLSSEACHSASSSASTTCSTGWDRRTSAIRDPSKIVEPKQVTLAAVDDAMSPLHEVRASASTGFRHKSSGPPPQAHGHQSRRLPPLPRDKLQPSTLSTPRQTARQSATSLMEPVLSARSPRLNSSHGAPVSSQTPSSPSNSPLRSPPSSRQRLSPLDPGGFPGAAPSLMPVQKNPGDLLCTFHAPLSLGPPPSMGLAASSKGLPPSMPEPPGEAFSAPLSMAPPSMAPPGTPSLAPPSLGTRPGASGVASPRLHPQSLAQSGQSLGVQAGKFEPHDKARTPNMESNDKPHTPAMSEAEPERPQSRQRARQVAPSLSSLHSRFGITSLLSDLASSSAAATDDPTERPQSNVSSAAANPGQLTYEAIVKAEPSASSSISPDKTAPPPPEVPRTPDRVAAPSSAAPAGPRRPAFPRVSTEANPMRALLGQLNARRELEDLEQMKAPSAVVVPAS